MSVVEEYRQFCHLSVSECSQSQIGVCSLSFSRFASDLFVTNVYLWHYSKEPVVILFLSDVADFRWNSDKHKTLTFKKVTKHEKDE